MHPFEYARATDSAHALTAGAKPQAKFVAGGTNLIDLMKCEVEHPARLVDINALPLATVEIVKGGIRIVAVAVAALDGVIALRGPGGERHIAAVDFHLLPGSTPQIEHALKHDELITSVFIPDAPHTRYSAYLKVRDRASYEFALSSAAVGLAVSGVLLRSAPIAV